MQGPETRYTRSGDVNIAYQVTGDGPLDVVFVPGWVSHIDYLWEEPGHARFLRRLASFSRLILFDKRGTGLSDRVPSNELPTLEQRVSDVRAVLQAVSSERAALVGVSEGGPMCALFAATHPAQTAALVMVASYARRMRSPDYPAGISQEDHERLLEEIRTSWGGPVGLAVRAPSMVGDERFSRWWATYLRMAASPGAAEALTRMNAEIDVREVLAAVHVPTLVLHRRGDRALSVEGGRYLAARTAGAKYVELTGDDHLPFVGEQDEILDEIEEFLTGMRRAPDLERVLATVLFTDIVGSTERAARLGDSAWRVLLSDHNRLVRKELDRYQGIEVATAGDGFFARFDGPARAVQCACAVSRAVRDLDLEVRAGLHTGECKIGEDGVTGLAVHVGARVTAAAGPGEVLVSQTVRDLVAGSGIEFGDARVAELKGVPGEWRLYAVVC